MAGRLALDSNIVITFIKGDGEVKHLISNVDEVLLPAPVVGELIYGALKSQNVEKNLALHLSFIERTNIISCDFAVAKLYGSIRTQLFSQGAPIPENDIWIAACCFEANVALATRDTHFSRIPNLGIRMLDS
ncbi:MAG: type II toxin-antitoxin system VapC family toxin [bacterium]